MNMVFWGMGVALGLAAWLGLFYGIRQLLRGRRWWAYAPVVLWSALYFLYQSTQWTKSIRYLVLTYPTFCVLAAVGMLALWGMQRSPSRGIVESSIRARPLANHLGIEL